ncbi:hypothetical protein M413DRAFT_16477 [Hebeloma cylindrosporum]|uniref:GPI transamidase component PIG-S n=1 Tax=Hebeloma cylindrosporum TaxID=76867 RepID=A0A0C3CDM7_HEBCY|nr:hypothetical protein M413DRAFT_16477 [Hebeloma cylindrosporum h7]
MDPPPTSTLRDPGTLFFQKDGIRRSIISSYWAAIILSLPLWWYFTSIERLTLPSSRVQQLAQQHLTLPISVCIEANTSLVNQVQSILTARIAQEPQRWRGLAVRLEAKAICDKSESETYSIISNNGPPYIRDRRLYFPLDEPNSPLQLVNTLSSLLVPYSSSSDPEHRVVQYSPHYRLAFSLLNEDAAAGGAVMNWNILGSIESHIKPILSRLSPLHNFTIESQVQFHAPLAFSPYPLEGDHSYGIKPSDLTVFVNSAEWTLSSSSSNDPVLHFILFIPSIRRRPLRILLSDDTPSASYAFLLPQWGGIVIHNPPPGYLNNDEFSPTEHHSVFSSFSTQLLALLGAPPLPHEITRSTTDRASLSDWQLDALIRRRALENAQGSQDTLQSIVKLVDQIENMPVGEDVRDDIEDALIALANMYESSSTSLRQAFAYSAQSFGLASRAFFNPGMLALLYFPAEHKYAVYTPLFASALTPIFVAALREFLAWKRARRAKNERKAS